MVTVRGLGVMSDKWTEYVVVENY